MLRKHDAARHAGKHLPDGVHVGIGFAVCPAEIFLIDQVPVANNRQATMLAAGLCILERLIEPALVYACKRADFRRLV